MNEELATWYNSDQNHARRALGRNTLTWIADNIPQNRTIFELGSGKGTEILSSRYNMVSVESNDQWLNTCDRATYINAPIINHWFDANVIARDKPGEYSLLIVDAPRVRSKVLEHLSLFRSEITWLIDDAESVDVRLMIACISQLQGRCVQFFDSGSRLFKTFAIIYPKGT